MKTTQSPAFSACPHLLLTLTKKKQLLICFCKIQQHGFLKGLPASLAAGSDRRVAEAPITDTGQAGCVVMWHLCPITQGLWQSHLHTEQGEEVSGCCDLQVQDPQQWRLKQLNSEEARGIGIVR